MTMDNEQRKAELERKLNLQLEQAGASIRYKIKTNGVQKVFIGYPMVMTLDEVEEYIPQIDLAFPDWRE